MAKFQPTGLEWMNKGLKQFNKEIKETADLMGRSANDIEKVTLSMKNLNKETGEWVKRTANVVAGTEGVTTTFDEMTREIDDAGDAIITTDRSIRTMDGAATRTGRRGGGIGIMTAAISGLSAAVGLFLLNALKNLIKFGLKAIVQALILPIKGFIELGKVIGKIAFAGFKAGAELVKNVLIGVGDAAVRTALKIAEVGAAMLKAGIDFQEGWTGVLKASLGLVDAAGNMTELGRAVREDFIDLIREIPLLPKEILRIGELAAQLDIPDEYLANFTRVVAAVTKATMLSADEATLGMGRIATVMDVAYEDYERLGSVIVWLGNNMGVVEGDILLLAQRITGVAVTAKLTTDEMLGVSAAILRLGATPYAGASAFQRFVNKVIPAMAKGDEKMEIFAAVAGMSSEQFIEAWEAAPAETFLEFVKGLTLAGPDAILVLDELGLANVRTSQTFLSLAAKPEILDKAMAGSKQAWIDNTALAREASLRYETVASKIQLLKNQFSILGLFLFDFLEPVIRGIIGVGMRLIAIFGPGMLKAFERLSPVMDDIAGWFGRLGLAIDYASRLIETGAPGWRGFTRMILELLGLDPALAKPITDTIQDIIKTIKDITDEIDWSAIPGEIKKWVEETINWFIKNWPDIKKTINQTVEDIKEIDWEEVHKSIIDPIERAIKWIEKHWPEIKATVIDTYNEIVDFLFGPKIQDIPGLPPVLGMEEGERIGGFIDGLIAGFDEFQASIERTATSIEENLIPALEQIIANIAIMLGADPERALDPRYAGEFTMTKLGELVERYEKIWEGIANFIELVTAQEVEGIDYYPPGFPHGRLPGVEYPSEALPAELPAGFPNAPSAEDTKATWAGVWGAIQDSMIGPLAEVLSEYYGFTSGFEEETERFGGAIVYNSLFPDMMTAIVAVFETGFAEIGTLWSTFWGGLITGAGTETDTFLSAMGVEQGGSSQGLLATIERSYNSFKDAGRSIVSAIADGMLEAAHLMVDALRSNINAMNVAVDTDEAINTILFDIGEKIVKKIADAIYDSYVLIYDALELALSLGGQFISAAAAALHDGGGGNGSGQIINDVINGSEQVVTSATGAVTAPAGGYGAGYTPIGLPQYGTQGEAPQVNINVGSIRDDMDMAALENVVRRTIAEEFA